MQSAAEKLRIALQMHAEGVAMHRLTLRRKHPEFSTEQIEDLVYVSFE
jgi:Rv0078B-related antitoxin